MIADNREKMLEEQTKKHTGSPLAKKKQYLHVLITGILRELNAMEARPKQQMDDLMENVRILYEKMLYGQCYIELKKAITLARNHKEDTALVAILEWYRKLNDITQNYNSIREYLDKDVQESFAALDRQKSMMEGFLLEIG